MAYLKKAQSSWPFMNEQIFFKEQEVVLILEFRRFFIKVVNKMLDIKNKRICI